MNATPLAHGHVIKASLAHRNATWRGDSKPFDHCYLPHSCSCSSLIRRPGWERMEEKPLSRALKAWHCNGGVCVPVWHLVVPSRRPSPTALLSSPSWPKIDTAHECRDMPLSRQRTTRSAGPPWNFHELLGKVIGCSGTSGTGSLA